MTRFLRISLPLILLLAIGPSSFGQEWAKEMFGQTSHDFGTVARGAKVEHRFAFENIYEEDVEIDLIRSSCGCTTTQISKPLLKTWDKSEVAVVVDTRAYLGQKDSTLTVTFKQPFPAEVRLHIHCYIRSDVVVQPGAIQFGTVRQGAGAKRRVTVNYAGRGDWRIERVEVENPHFKADVVETGRTDGGVTYELAVELADDAPVGYIRDHVVLVTNDSNPRTSRVPVSVEGVVASAITVRPSPLLLGVVHAGQPVTRRLVVQGAKPFRIVAASCDDQRFHCDVPEKTCNPQLLPVTFESDNASGKISSTIHIETDQGGGEKIEVKAHVQIVQ